MMRRAIANRLGALFCAAALGALLSTAACADEPALERDAPAPPVSGACSANGDPAGCIPNANVEPEPIEAAERIVDFHSRIAVAADGGMTVTETVKVVANGEAIQHGIYRDFPTVYPDTFQLAESPPLTMLRHQVGFEVVKVQRDGKAEPHHTEARDNGVRVYFGDANTTLAPGTYTYTLTYRTDHQLGFFTDYDQLYWNVTGNGWEFPIEKASADVTLPAGVPPERITLEGYTGPQGSTERNLGTAVDQRSGMLEFHTTAPLDRHEGLTIVASFPKGFVKAPTQREQWIDLIKANPITVIGPFGFLLVTLYYLVTWVRFGRDPARGTIIPLFEPPLGLDAAGLRYVRDMAYDERCFTAALVGLAAKGWARISEEGGTYTLTRSAERHTPLGPAERRVNSTLLSEPEIELKQKNHSKISSAIRSLRQALKGEYDGKMFRHNRSWLIPGVVLSVLIILAAGFSGPVQNSYLFGFMLVWLSGWTFACFHLAGRVWSSLRDLTRPGAGVFVRIGAGILVLFSLAFAIPFLLGEVFALILLVSATTVLMVPVLLGMAGLDWIFYYLLRQPTLAGRKLMDQIEGFKMYLSAAEGAELARAAPAKTTQLYESLLPYAIALEVENEWAEQFNDVLARAAQSDEQGYRPVWYSGNSFNHYSAPNFASALSSSLGSSVASSSTAPGSSSGGGGGGGSSGGGGGGGGGGGW
jgi:uncharacterized membrane protein YgcG